MDVENGRVSSIVNVLNQNAGSSVRGRIPKSSSKDDLIKDQSQDSALQEALNSSSSSVSLIKGFLIDSL